MRRSEPIDAAASAGIRRRAAILGRMDDVLTFEIPTLADLHVFDDRFRGRRPGWSYPDGDVWLFALGFSSGEDFASLLRDVQQLVAELGLTDVRFWLDGRSYVLGAARDVEGTWATH
jgi:hypothetical protein